MTDEVGTSAVVLALFVFSVFTLARTAPPLLLPKAAFILSGGLAFGTWFLMSLDVLDGTVPAALTLGGLALLFGSVVWIFAASLQAKSKTNIR